MEEGGQRGEGGREGHVSCVPASVTSCNKSTYCSDFCLILRYRE